MKTLASKADFGERTKNIFEAMTQNIPDSNHEEARKFFLKSTSTRSAAFYIMTNYFERNKITAADVYSTLHPKFGSKSSFVNFITLGVKKGYFCLYNSKSDSRKKNIVPCAEFVITWCKFISKIEGAPIDKKIDWSSIISNASNCK
tara:strand:- start:40 stop:477 length:438 start_codon:yes stop_codon:yes gene_type:complete